MINISKKTLFIVITIFLFFTIAIAQNIINKIGGTSENEKFQVTDSEGDVKLVVQGDGKVGIGTTEPNERLTVNGVIEAKDGIKFPDGSLQMTASNLTQAQKTDNTAEMDLTSLTLGTYYDVISKTITLSDVNSKVIIMFSAGYYSNEAEDIFCIERNSTIIKEVIMLNYHLQDIPVNIQYMDVPGTTDVTYTIKVKRNNNKPARIGNSSLVNSISLILLEIAP